ncbi:hypothetical protein D3C77_561230 [compost metagenome]
MEDSLSFAPASGVAALPEAPLSPFPENGFSSVFPAGNEEDGSSCPDTAECHDPPSPLAAVPESFAPASSDDSSCPGLGSAAEFACCTASSLGFGSGAGRSPP